MKASVCMLVCETVSDFYQRTDERARKLILFEVKPKASSKVLARCHESSNIVQGYIPVPFFPALLSFLCWHGKKIKKTQSQPYQLNVQNSAHLKRYFQLQHFHCILVLDYFHSLSYQLYLSLFSK